MKGPLCRLLNEKWKIYNIATPCASVTEQCNWYQLMDGDTV